MTVTTNITQKTTSTIERQIIDLKRNDPDLEQEANDIVDDNINYSDETLTTSTVRISSPSKSYRFIPLRMGGSGRTHVPSRESASLLYSEVAIEDLQQMTEKFYENAFQDVTLDKFIRSHDDPHGERFALWIHQKLSGSKIWDEDRKSRNKDPVRVANGTYAVVHDRTSAHVAAWHSPKRPSNEVGRHFTLNECRVWMRLHFWALRSSKMIQKSPSFVDYYVRFIGHFVRVYESTAPMFARDAFRWSADPANIEKYINGGRIMNDIVDLTYEEAIEAIPDEEYNDFDWPYNQSPRPVSFDTPV